ncbi:MAG: thermonuclease family protein [Verrucomicrobia bacterium]|nr:thermonuclease family protein [Verrucomicrobiota bacterium]
MTERPITPASVSIKYTTYPELRRGVAETLFAGQRAVERAKVLTYWRTGWLINEHVLLHQKRADYGAQVIARLARDLGVDRTTLYQCTLFARYFPIVGARRQLTWAHYRRLVQIDDAKVRNALAAEAEARKWTSRELHDRVIALTARETTARLATPGGKGAAASELLAPKRGRPGIYRVVSVGGALAVDLGFACYFDPSAEQAAALKAGDLVQLDDNDRLTAADHATKADLFNYRVELIKVVDGDTLWVKIYLRPRQWLKQKLRLRGLDCPEMTTPEGRAAKRFVDALVAKTTAVTINTTKPDKYDRYLADAFLSVTSDPATGSGSALGHGPGDDVEIFLNNALLENGHAERKDAWQFGDWEPELLK